MAHPDDLDNQRRLKNRINNPIITDTQAIRLLGADQFFCSTGKGSSVSFSTTDKTFVIFWRGSCLSSFAVDFFQIILYDFVTF
jgi:hypothetical protein